MDRVQLNRRRRRQLLWFLLGFLSVQGVLAVGVERFWPAVRDPEFAVRAARLRQRRIEAPQRPLVLALGSSRTLMGLDAARLSALPGADGGAAPLVFTFGVPGSGPMLETVCLRRLLADGLRPDFLLLEVLPMGLSQRGDRPPQEEHSLDPARLRGDEARRLLDDYFDQPDLAWLRWLLARALPIYRHQAELRAALGVDPGRAANLDPLQWLDDHGWQAFNEPETAQQRRQRTAFAVGQYADCVTHFRLAPGAARAWHDLLDLCRREGIPVALLLMPESKPFRDQYCPEARQGIDGFVRGLAGDCDLPVVDARAWLDDYGEAAFWDGHHLNADGAAVFTERFGREVLPGLLRRCRGATAETRTAARRAGGVP